MSLNSCDVLHAHGLVCFRVVSVQVTCLPHRQTGSSSTTFSKRSITDVEFMHPLTSHPSFAMEPSLSRLLSALWQHIEAVQAHRGGRFSRSVVCFGWLPLFGDRHVADTLGVCLSWLLMAVIFIASPTYSQPGLTAMIGHG